MKKHESSILIVDDDRLTRLLLSSSLSEEGYAVATAEDGGQALVMLHAQPFDVVLLDLLMPEMDGYQVLEQMKSNSSLRYIPVIVVSGLDDMESVVRCIEMGATDYLIKPVDLVLLRARLNASLADKRLRDLEQAYLQQIQRMSARLRAIFEGAAMGIGIMDLDGRLTESNPALQHMLGYRGEELRQMGLAELVHPEDAPANRTLFQEMVGGKRDRYQVEQRYRRQEGQVIWGRLTASLVRDSQGHPQFGIGMVEDVTAQKLAAAVLQEQQRALAVLEARQRVIVAEERLRREIAELLHGPVQTKLLMAWFHLGECENLLDADPPRGKALLAQARAEIDQVREQEVRRASHLLHPSIIQVGLLPAIRSLAERFEESFPVALDVDAELSALDNPLEPGIPEPLRLTAYRVVEEALTNVYRHAQASGVGIRLGIDAEGRLAIVVRDDGRGFDRADLRPGLGLNSIAGRVDQAGGSWEVTSAVGQGTTVAVRLPLGLRTPLPAAERVDS